MLTDTQIKKTKPTEKAFKLSDAGGLYLYVTPSGGKLWRLKYRLGGSEKLLSIGPYPAVSLLDARRVCFGME
ncbi:Arm DNA-binding domain-containing protein [Pseudorhizobium flavum]|uniref:Arm DNA-binding domain-containing protein n=1 Tax=Pseudorhizobium flavum TaxID=1335061 RepID=UPI0024910CC2|nr:Arm DNA-binding domain-containing protein [Pseudorhizobium flavum]